MQVMAWFLNRALTNFRAAVNAEYPGRDKSSDGTIGDAAHQSRSSDHNPDTDGSVDAWDMDVDLGVPNAPAEIERLKRVFESHPSSKYWIHNDRISFRDEGWKPRSYAYAGPGRNRHDKHVHWNTREAYEDSTAPWVLDKGDEDDMPITDADAVKVARAVVNQKLGASAVTVGMVLQGLPTALADLGDGADTQAIVAGVLAKLTPQAIADAIPDDMADQVADRLAARLAS